MPKKAKKELTPQQKKVQTALNWTLNIVCILIILFAFILSIVTITQTTDENNLPHIGKKYFMAVKSDSMTGTFEKGDMIITVKVEEGEVFEVGQVITFKQKIWNNGAYQLIVNTHRIVDVSADKKTYITKGDKPGNTVTETVGRDDILAKWGTPGSQGDTSSYGKVLKGLGKINNWLNDEEHMTASGKSTRYFLVIVLPLIILFVAYAGVLIYSLVKNKVAKAQEVAVNDLSEEEKARLAQEYLASQGISLPEQQQAPVEESAEESVEEANEEPTDAETPAEESSEEVQEEVAEDADKKDEE